MTVDIRIFLSGVITGSPKSRARHLMQAKIIQDAIYQRWEVLHPERWQVKHLRWFLQEQLKTRASQTRYRYWLTTQLLVQRLHKSRDWLPLLRGPWTQKNSPAGEA